MSTKRLSVTVLCVLTALSAQAGTASWSADSGKFPDTDLPYDLLDTAAPEVPEIVAGELVLSTSANSELMRYSMGLTNLAFPPVTEIRFGLRLGPGSTASGLYSRGELGVAFTSETSVGNTVWFRDGLMFLNVSDSTRGATATVDTSSQIHDYLIRIAGTAAGSPVEVYQDGTLKLTGALFTSTSHNGSIPRFYFGQGSTLSRGTSYWTYFEHNAYATGCPSPCGDEAMLNRRPTFSWCPATGATWYNLLIMREGRLYDRQWIQGATEWRPDSDLRSGSYCWWVRPWGPLTGLGDWSAGCCFSVNTCDAAPVDGLSPDGACLDGTPLELSWRADACATHYQVVVNRNGETWFKQWVKTGQTLGDVTLALPEAPPFGSYRWWVRGWNPDGLSAWSDPAEFEVGAPVPLQPVGVQTNPVTFTVDDSCSARAEWYQIWVRRDGIDVTQPWIRRSDTTDCGGSNRCYGPVALPEGDYTYWFRAWAPGGMSSWSDKVTFSIAGP